MGQHVQAEKFLKKSLEILPNNIDALNGLANVYSYTKDHEKDVMYRTAVLIIQPDNQEALVGIANSYTSLKKFDEAIKQYDAVLEINQLNVNAIIGKGNVFMDLRKYEKALTYYEYAQSIDSDNVNALRGKSLAYVNLGEYEEAKKLDDEIKKQILDNIDGNPKSQNNEKIPSWVKNTFGWYYEDKISEREMISAIKFLIEKKIIILE